MEENEYREVYYSAIPTRCVFEKGILARRCDCAQARRSNLAEREAVACSSDAAQARCVQWLKQLREKSAFALHLPEVDGTFSEGPVPRSQLPHNQEMKIQIGGLQGLAQALGLEVEEGINDVYRLMETAGETWGGWEQFPFAEVVRAVSHYKSRARHRSRP
jgi:hypothetical protein